MALINPKDEELVEEMSDDDTFVLVTVDGVTRRIKKSDIAQPPDIISGAYENARGELILIIGNGGEEESSP